MADDWEDWDELEKQWTTIGEDKHTEALWWHLLEEYGND